MKLGKNLQLEVHIEKQTNLLKLFSSIVYCFAIHKNEREKKWKSSSKKFTFCVYTLSTTLKWLLMLWYAIWILSYNLIHHIQNHYQYKHTTLSDIATPQTTSLSYKIILPPLYHNFMPSPHSSIQFPFLNSLPGSHFDTIPSLITLWFDSIPHLALQSTKNIS